MDKAFEQNFNAGKTQLVYRWVAGDLETPVSAYLKLCNDEPYAFLLESVEGGAALGRYSVIGFDPDLIWKCADQKIEIALENGGFEPMPEAPLASLRRHIEDSKIDESPADLPPMAVSGLFGYLGYDMVRLIEDIPNNNPDDLQIPDSILIRPRILCIFDNVQNRICLVTPVYANAKSSDLSAAEIYNKVQLRLDAVMEKLENPLKAEKAKSELKLPLEVVSNTPKETYYKSVEKAVDYIHQGEIFQVVLGQRFSVDFDLPSFDLYRSLRRLNPSPFMFHLAFDGFSIVGASPEILVRVRDDIATIRPLAGTRKRGQTPEEDKALAQELLADPKERAEHLMLLDLGRNDIGRIAQYGSVKVTAQYEIERYSHVMHIVSNVEGKLREDLDIVEALFAGFPAGTLSGAPKVRAMEIIDELELSKRSYYGGAIGYFSANRTLDTCISLRTALVKDGKMYVQASGGIVADSTAEFEYEESCNKAKALIRAAEMAIEEHAPNNQ